MRSTEPKTENSRLQRSTEPKTENSRLRRSPKPKYSLSLGLGSLNVVKLNKSVNNYSNVKQKLKL